MVCQLVEDALKSELEELCRLVDASGVLRAGLTVEVREIIEHINRNFEKVKLMVDSIRVKGDALCCVTDLCGVEKILYLAKNGVEPPTVFKDNIVGEFYGYLVSIVDFNVDNLRRLLRERPEFGPKNLGRKPRLGLGVRMLFTLNHLLNTLKKIGVSADFQLSAGREFSLKEVVNAPPGLYPEWLGHTGLDAETLYNTIALECFKAGFDDYGTEIDHLIIVRQPGRALARIISHGERVEGGETEGLEASMDYNRRVIDEAVKTGFVRGITIDASDLIRYEFVDPSKWPIERVEERFLMEFGGEAFEVLRNIRPNHRYVLDSVEISFTEEEVMRIALKYRLCLLKSRELYEYFKRKVDWDFSYELSLDETPELTDPKELFYCLSECRRMGMPVDLVAPNVGFSKREDYGGSLDELEGRVRVLSSIAEHFNAILDFHSGSDKSVEVYRTISKACGGRLKLKMSTVYQLKFFETLSEFPEGSEERRVFEEIWDYTLNYVRKRASEGDRVAEKQLKDVVKRISESGFRKSPGDDFFRYYSFIVVNAKNPEGGRIFMDRLYRLASRREVYEKYAAKVFNVTKTVADALDLIRASLE
ncbi:MAG: tagaturonate epimerase family protein [Candidatus Bathyarchaeia archaeon]